MCNTCNINNCSGCSGINLSSIKGDPGADSTIPGPAGNGISTIIVHSSLSDTWLVTYTDGTTANIAVPAGSVIPGTISYFAWADDNSGTGFTNATSDKLYLGITDTVATAGSPIVSDFVGKWFLINQPKVRFDAAAYIGVTESIDGRGASSDIPFTTTIPALTVPLAYFNNSECYIEYNFEGMVELIDAAISLPYNGLTLFVNINGVEVEIGKISFASPNQIPFKSTVSVYVDASNNYNISSILFTEEPGSYVSGGVQMSGWSGSVSATPATTPMIFSLLKVGADNAHRKIHLQSHNVTAVNPIKTTII
mgnify:CR=1 FL=1|jgi:hypothetical protein|tara:strand:- start:511 stop:1437 length:927 start_codon:yes stop_codon:yes gene_type:complete